VFETASLGPILTQRGFRVRSLLASIGIHAAVVLAVFTLHFYQPIETAKEQPMPVTLLAPQVIHALPAKYMLSKPVKPLPSPATFRDPVSELSAPEPRPAARAFEAPKRVLQPTPTLTIPMEPSIEVEPVRLAAARPELPRFATSPPPPLKTDNLPAAYASPAAASQGVIRSTSFGSSITPPVEARGISVSQRPAAGVFSSAVVVPNHDGPVKAASTRSDTKTGVFHGVEVGSPRTNLTATPQTDDSKPLQILSKPRPEYTAEARQLQIEGEALLEVTFSAIGQVRVLRLIRGLGHGLDENAFAAAQAIRFYPAEQAGTRVDLTAIVHTVFQLAY
jgi:TonB family protein